MYDKIKKEQPKIPGFISEEASDFLLRILAKDPEERLGTKSHL